MNRVPDRQQPAAVRAVASQSRGKTMKRRPLHTCLLHTCLAIAGAAAPLALLPAAAHAQAVTRPASTIVLSIGRGELVTVGGAMADVFVANDAVADVQIKSRRQLYVFGKAGGETTVYASNAAGDIVWSANIRVGSNIDSVDQMLRVAMPDAKVTVSTMGSNTFLLTGTVGAPEDAAEAQRLVAAFVGKDANVISRLKMATPLQVNLQVKFAEVSRSLVRTLGVNLTTIGDGGNGFQFGLGQGRTGFAPTFRPGSPMGIGSQVQLTLPDGTVVPGTAVTPTTNGSTLALAGRFLGLDLLGALDAGETVGLVSTLAQPNLTALSGETADFLAGGEYPIPISQALGTITIEYKRYGVSLAYTPTVLANGRISLRVRPEVSELSSQGAVTIGSVQVPALTIRRTETTVELGSGQSFMIAGLLSNNSQNTITKMPGAGDLPILGSLFRSTNFRKGETELVIVVTPYLVNPVDANQIKLPTDGYQAPNELQRVLGNMNDSHKSGGDRPKPSAAPATPPAPKVGVLDAPASPAQTGPAAEPAAQPRRGSGDRQASATPAAAAPAPGFTLN